jgi:hypothetical protein
MDSTGVLNADVARRARPYFAERIEKVASVDGFVERERDAHLFLQAELLTLV